MKHLHLIKNLILYSAPGLSALNANPRQLELSVEIPELHVAEYHRPYVAVWIENDKHKVVENLAVWYDVAMADREGESWLKDLRQWWRKSGRRLQMPVDGVSGPTQPPGKHTLVFGSEHSGFLQLAEGSYHLVVEASREVGGRELLRIPFDSSDSAISTRSVEGEYELGIVTLSIQ